jgi:hypothetical protein
MPLLSIIRCVGSLMIASRSRVFADASESKPFNAGRSASGNASADSKRRLSIAGIAV